MTEGVCILINFVLMKKIIFLFVFLFAFAFFSEAQNRFNAGVKVGISTSQVEGDTYGGFNKAGIDGGITITAKLNLIKSYFYP